MVMARGIKAALLLAVGALAEHPCVNEVASACPDRPGSDVATCLKDPSEHDTATDISSECTDFMALNKACAEDIEKKCDGGFFSDDTIPCLTQWTEKEDLSERCQKVISWAVPQDEEAEEEAPTNELGMTEEEAKEKEEWRAKRKAVRTEAIERMKMKDVDKKIEEDRIALEEYKEKDPEGYAQMVQQQEEEKKQKAKFAQMERARAAALERKKKQEAGLLEEEDAPKKKEEAVSSTKKSKKKGGSWLYSIVSLAFVGLVVYGVYMLMAAPSGPRKGGGSGKKGKKGR